MRRLLAILAMAAALVAGHAVHAQPVEPRFALVIGNGKYRQGALPSSLNNAALVAETLRSIGFDVTGAADLKQPDLLDAVRKFAAKVRAGGPTTVAVFYFSGYGFSLEGENLLVAADALLERDTDIPLDTIRLSEVIDPLSRVPARAKIFIVDASRALPFPIKDMKLAPGLAALEAPAGSLVAFSDAPAAVAADGSGPYGAYPLALAENLRIGGLDVAEAFTRARLRVHQLSRGAQTPWHVSSLAGPLVLVPPNPAAPPPLLHAVRPMREAGVEGAYALAIQQDTLAGYAEFALAFPSSGYAPRIRAMMRARRETMTWQQARATDTARGYWSYEKRYPDGIYAADAERRLDRLSEALQPPPAFEPVTFAGVPPPIQNEPRERAALPTSPPPPSRMIAPQPSLYANFSLPLPSLPGAGRNDAAFPPVHTLPPPGSDEEGAEAEKPKPAPVHKRRPVAPVTRPATPPPSAGIGAPTILAPPQQLPANRPPAQRQITPAPSPFSGSR